MKAEQAKGYIMSDLNVELVLIYQNHAKMRHPVAPPVPAARTDTLFFSQSGLIPALCIYIRM